MFDDENAVGASGALPVPVVRSGGTVGESASVVPAMAYSRRKNSDAPRGAATEGAGNIRREGSFGPR